MVDDPTAALREQARERGRRLLATTPFDEIADRATLLLTAPPAGVPLTVAPATAGFWLLVDPSAGRSLPDPYRAALVRGGVYVENVQAKLPADGPPYALTVSADPPAALEGITRRSLEVRWSLRHSEPIHDRMGRYAQLLTAASRYPEDAPERIVRGLWLQLVAAIHGLWVIGTAAPAVALPTAGEASGALCRLACVYDEGDHPTVDMLLPAARQTRIGRRVSTWLDDLAAAIAGDAPATRRVLAAGEQVLLEVAGVMGERYRDRAWLREPEAYALRATR